MLFAQPDQVGLADQRLAARQHIEVDAQLLALGDDLIHICKAEVVLVAVLPGPAAHAVHVAGRGGVKQDQPGDVALVLDAVLPDGLGAPEKRLVPQVESRGAGHVGVGLVQHAVDELVREATVVLLITCFLLRVLSRAVWVAWEFLFAQSVAFSARAGHKQTKRRDGKPITAPVLMELC